MALIKFTFAPAWKRIMNDEPETEESIPVEAESETAEPTTVEIVDEDAVEPKRRLVTLRRLLLIGAVLGGIALARRVRSPGGMVVEESKIDVETPDEDEVEQ